MQPNMGSGLENPDEATGGGVSLDFKVGGSVRKLRTMDEQEMAKFYTGQTGAELEEVAHHGTSKYREYGLIDETFLASLRLEPGRIDELVKGLGENREEVSIVAIDVDGDFTRMFLKKNEQGVYKEVNKNGVKREERERTHRQDGDLFIFEKGVKAAVA